MADSVNTSPPCQRFRDVELEFITARDGFTEKPRARLAALGVPRALLDSFAVVGILPVIIEGERFQVHESGVPHCIVAVRGSEEPSIDHPDPAAVVRCGAIIDLVAFRTDTPDRWATRLGVAKSLGCAKPQVLMLDPELTPVWRNPLHWLQADATGIAVLASDPGDVQSVLLPLVGRIEAEDPEHAAELRFIASRPWPIPHITARQSARGAA